jgi:hypothetical protein
VLDLTHAIERRACAYEERCETNLMANIRLREIARKRPYQAVLNVTRRAIVAPERGLPMTGAIHGSLGSGTTRDTGVSRADVTAGRQSDNSAD